MVKIININTLFVFFGIIYIFSSSAFAQSTPPLDKPIEKPPVSEMSEAGRIQEKNDVNRMKEDSPDSDENHPNSPNVDINAPAAHPSNSAGESSVYPIGVNPGPSSGANADVPSAANPTLLR